MQCLVELVDECGAFFDERDFIAAEDAQFGDEGILRPESTPGVAVHAQGIGQRPGIVPVGLVAAGALALAVAFGVHWD